MIPATPIVPGMKLVETVYAKDQPPYLPLPVFRYEDGTVLMRWHMTVWERLLALVHGDVYVWLMTFNKPLQPISVRVERPPKEPEM